MKVACKGHHHQKGIQEGKTKKQKRNKPGQPHKIRVGQEGNHIYIYEQCKATQIGRQGKDKDNECARHKMKEEGMGDSNQIK